RQKTPRAELQTVVENLRDQPAGREQARILRDQIARMSQQIDYQLQRASLRRSGLVRHSAALQPLAGKLGEALGKVYRDKDVTLQLDMPEGTRLPIEEGALLELLGNSLENAYRLCLSRIRVSARALPGGWEVWVEEDGRGGAWEQGERVMGRGERVNASHQGQGIGLGVIRDIIESYGGSLSRDASPLGGAAFRVWLPGDARPAKGRAL